MTIAEQVLPILNKADDDIAALTIAKVAAENRAIKAEADLVTATGTIAAQAARIAALEAELGQTPEPEPSPTPEPAKPKTMLVGTSLYRLNGETSEAGFARRTKAWGAEPEMVRYFFSGMPSGWPQFGAAQTVVSFKPPSVKDMGAGKLDGTLNNWLNSLPKDKKVRRVAVYHEREDNIESGQFSLAEAKLMDAKMRQLIDAANERNGTNVTFGLILMGWTGDARSNRKVENYLPTGWTYDWMGWDAYPGNSLSMDLPALSYTQTLYQRCYDLTKAHNPNANVFICETATSNKGHTATEYDSMQAQWITGAVKIANDIGIRGWMYWDSVTGAGPSNDYQVKAPKAAAAMGAAIRS